MKQTRFIDCDSKKVKYTLTHTATDEDGRWYEIVCKDANIHQEFHEEDIDLITHTVIPESIQEQQQNQKVQLSVRFFRNDIDSIKQYAKEHGFSYQNLIRIALKEYNKKLLKEEK